MLSENPLRAVALIGVATVAIATSALVAIAHNSCVVATLGVVVVKGVGRAILTGCRSATLVARSVRAGFLDALVLVVRGATPVVSTLI